MADTLTLPNPPKVDDGGPQGPSEPERGYGDYGSGGRGRGLRTRTGR